MKQHRFLMLSFLLIPPVLALASVDIRITNKSASPESIPIRYAKAYLLSENSTAIDSLILDINGQGIFSNVIVGVATPPQQPASFHVSQNYPNPFNPSTRLEIDVERSSTITCRIYSLDGKLVKNFIFDSSLGSSVIEWYGEDDGGRPVSSGVYFARIENGEMSTTIKMVLLGSSLGRSRVYQVATAASKGRAYTAKKLSASKLKVRFANTDSTFPRLFPWSTGLFEVSGNLDTTFYSPACSPMLAPVYPSAYGAVTWHPGGRIAFNWTKILRIDGCTGAVDLQDIDRDSTGFWIINPNGTGLQRLLPYALANPEWSPDGQWIAFGAVQIFKMRFTGTSFDTTTLLQLTTEGRNFYPDWSPDGLWIAYDNTDCGGAGEPPPANSCGILIVRDNGSSRRFLVRGRQPSWSPDGAYLCYTGLLTEIYRANISDTADVVRLTSFNQVDPYGRYNREPRYSPDGTRIAFTSQALGDVPQVWVMNADGTFPRQITTLGGDAFSWSPDGTQIVFVRHDFRKAGPNNGTLWVMNADGSNKRQITYNHGLVIDP